MATPNVISTVPNTRTKLSANAIVIERPGCARVHEVDIPLPGPREVLVRMEGCGICGSNLPVWEGRPWFQYPLEPGMPGHEGWGTIEGIGEEVEGLTEGARVAMLSYRAFAGYEIVPASSCVRIPDALDGSPFPAEALGCAINVFRRSNIRAGERVAIIGIGFLGALLTQLCVKQGAEVVAISRRAWALKCAKDFGAARAIPMTSPVATTDGYSAAFDCVIEATGVQATLDLASELTRERGRLIIAGYHQDGARQVDMQLWNWRGIDVINAHERDAETYLEAMREAVTAVMDGVLNPAPLMTHMFAPDEMDEAMELLRTRPEGFMKAWIRF